VTAVSPAARQHERERERHRGRRKHRVRGKVVQQRNGKKAARQIRDEIEDYWRPKTRGDCLYGPRPCPYAGCPHHLAVDVTRTGNLLINFPDLESWEIPETCALDVADRGGETLERCGELMNFTRERCRQVQNIALAKIANGPSAPMLRAYLEASIETENRDDN